MKNLIIWVAVTIACFGILPAFAQETQVETIRFTVNIPQAEFVTCQVFGEDHPLTDGANMFEVPIDTRVYFGPQYPWKFSTIKDKAGKKASGFYGTDWYLYADASAQDEEYTIEMVDINDLRTAQFTLNVDDPTLVSAVMTGYYTVLDLDPGENIVKFEPNVETYLNLSPTNNLNPFYSVKLNGVTVSPQGLTYGIKLIKDCVIDIVAILPDEEKTVTFTYSDGARDAITLSVNNKTVTEFDGNTLAVKLGDLLTVVGKTNTYKFNEVSVNDFPVTFYGSYTFNVMRDTHIHIDARPYDTVSATVIVNDPELVRISNNGEDLNLTAGENLIQLPETNTDISWTVSPMAILNSVRVNGGDPLPPYPNTYSVQKGDVIVFDVMPRAFDLQAIVWIDNIAGKACSNYIDLSSITDRSVQYTFESGYNILEFYQAMNPFTLAWGGYDPENPDVSLTAKVYVNGEFLSSEGESPTSYHMLTLANGDVLKLFMDSDPVECHVGFDIADGIQANVVKDIVTDVANPSSGFDCFAGTLVNISGNGIKVAVNGQELSPEENENGLTSYSFTIEEPATTVTVTAGEDTGVIAIGQKTDSYIYNMQGLKVGRKSDLRGLTPGIYVIDGHKVIVTE